MKLALVEGMPRLQRWMRLMPFSKSGDRRGTQTTPHISRGASAFTTGCERQVYRTDHRRILACGASAHAEALTEAQARRAKRRRLSMIACLRPERRRPGQPSGGMLALVSGRLALSSERVERRLTAILKRRMWLATAA